jgi:2-polyprenyl-3-methyl-5-hydroxy-6-metoxy-1,4-benzoquinol methylase
MYGIAFAQQHPHAHIVAQDWPVVLPVALEHAAKLGVADRYSTLPGSAFDVHFGGGGGGGYDVILLPNFLHHFDAPACTTLLRKCHASLRPGGLCVTLEFAPDNSRLQPPNAGAFALVMLAATPAGDAYTVNELTAMYQHAGFPAADSAMLPLGMQRAIFGKRPE